MTFPFTGEKDGRSGIVRLCRRRRGKEGDGGWSPRGGVAPELKIPVFRDLGARRRGCSVSYLQGTVFYVVLSWNSHSPVELVLGLSPLHR